MPRVLPSFEQYGAVDTFMKNRDNNFLRGSVDSTMGDPDGARKVFNRYRRDPVMTAHRERHTDILKIHVKVIELEVALVAVDRNHKNWQ